MTQELDINKSDGSYRHVLRLAGPMILSTSSTSIQFFLDRMFLAWHSQDALAASGPAGIASFTILAFFLGTVGYVGTFVAQYFGAGRQHRIGPAVWQGIFLALIATLIIWTLYPAAQAIMDFAGHEQSVRELELQYFRITIIGGGLPVLLAALNGFYTGRGRMYTVMAVTMVVSIVNVALNYCWIFGHLGFPSWGIAGAAWATVTAGAVGVVIMASLFFSPTNRSRFNTARHIRFEWGLVARILRYGTACGLHWFVDVSAFALFIFLVGRIGTTELATVNAVFNINHLAFMPMIGLAIATSTIVGQFAGRSRPDLAQRATSASLRLALLYMSAIAAVFVLLPEPLLVLFKSRSGDADFPAMLELGRVLLIFVAIYTVSDGLAIVYSAALRGAGDTIFILVVTGIFSWIAMVLPVYLGLTYFNWGVITSFTCVMAYILSLTLAFYLRYRGGKWKTMRVIEAEEIKPVAISEGPLVEI